MTAQRHVDALLNDIGYDDTDYGVEWRPRFEGMASYLFGDTNKLLKQWRLDKWNDARLASLRGCLVATSGEEMPLVNDKQSIQFPDDLLGFKVNLTFIGGFGGDFKAVRVYEKDELLYESHFNYTMREGIILTLNVGIKLEFEPPEHFHREQQYRQKYMQKGIL